MKIVPHQLEEWERAAVTIFSASALIASAVFLWSGYVQDLEQTYVQGLWGLIHGWYVTSLWVSTALAVTLIALGSIRLAKGDPRYALVALAIGIVCLTLWTLYSTAKPR